MCNKKKFKTMYFGTYSFLLDIKDDIQKKRKLNCFSLRKYLINRTTKKESLSKYLYSYSEIFNVKKNSFWRKKVKKENIKFIPFF